MKWLTSLLPSLNLPINITDDESRACLSNGTVLCQILNKLRPGSVNVVNESDHSLPSQSENVKTFLKALDGLRLPQFEISDVEKGFRSSSINLSSNSLNVVHQIDAKYPALLFKQQLTAYVEKIYGIIRDNLKKDLSPMLSS